MVTLELSSVVGGEFFAELRFKVKERDELPLICTKRFDPKNNIND